MLAFIAVLPILIVGVLMIAFMWPSVRAMPLGWVTAALAAAFFWDMPVTWILAATIGGIIYALDILLIVFGAVLILQMMKQSGALNSISSWMSAISDDRRIQLIIIAWLMGSFLEGAAGFGTPPAVAAPLLAGMGFPPLIAAASALIADSTAVSFGAVGVPVWGGLAPVEELLSLPYDGWLKAESFSNYLHVVSIYSAALHALIGTFIPLALVTMMTKMADGSFSKGLEVWPAALAGGLCFTVPQFIITLIFGPELPSLLGALIGLLLFLIIIKRRAFIPVNRWDFPPRERWPDYWEGKMKAEDWKSTDHPSITTIRAWSPYIIIAVILVLSRLNIGGLEDLLKSRETGWQNILGTNISRTVTPLYNPGLFPFIAIALIMPFIFRMDRKKIWFAWKDTISMIIPAAVALFFTLGMVYIMMNSGEASDRDSMMIVMARAGAAAAGAFWHLVAPLIGLLGTFISGSNTVSNIMFSPFQFRTAMQLELPSAPVLALQNVGGAAGNMIGIHNIVAVLTTVGLLGQEGRVIRKNIWVAAGYGLLAGILSWTAHLTLFN